MTLHYIDNERADSCRNQVQDTSQYRIRAGTPLVFEGRDKCRPVDPSSDERVDGVAVMKKHHPAYSPHVDSGIRTDTYCRVTDDGERIVRDFSSGDHREYEITTYGVDRDGATVPTASISDGDTLQLRSITEDCEAYTGDGAPMFESRETAVSLVSDKYAVDGVRIAPTEEIDGQVPSLEIGTTAQLGGFMSKASEKGYNTIIGVTVKK